MHLKHLAPFLLGPALLLSSLAAYPQQKTAADQSNDPIDQMHVPYGISISLEDAKKVIATATALAQKQKWEVAIAVVDVTGELISFDRLDGTETAAVQMAISKAQSAVAFRRPTKAFEDRLAEGGDNLRILAMKGVMPVDGGVPIVVGGKIVGAVGISGGSSAEDGRCAAAAAATLK